MPANQRGITVTVGGLKEMNARIIALQKEFGIHQAQASKMIMRALHDAARPITAEAKRLAPVLQDETSTVTFKDRRFKSYEGTARRRKGALRDGIVQHTSREEYGTVYVRVRNRGYIFGQNVTRGTRNNSALAGNPNYWWLVEFGTSKMAARPFLRPAFDSNRLRSLELFRKSLANGIDVVMRDLQKIRMAA